MKYGSKRLAFGHGETIIKTVLSMVTNWQLIAGIFLFGLSFAFTTVVYSKFNLNVAYPIMVGCSFLLMTLATVLFLGEKLTPLQILGSIFLIGGIALISTNLKST